MVNILAFSFFSFFYLMAGAGSEPFLVLRLSVIKDTDDRLNKSGLDGFPLRVNNGNFS